MKTGKETKPAGKIHRQQLFYWMGRSIVEFVQEVLRQGLDMTEVCV